MKKISKYVQIIVSHLKRNPLLLRKFAVILFIFIFSLVGTLPEGVPIFNALEVALFTAVIVFIAITALDLLFNSAKRFDYAASVDSSKPRINNKKPDYGMRISAFRLKHSDLPAQIVLDAEPPETVIISTMDQLRNFRLFLKFNEEANVLSISCITYHL